MKKSLIITVGIILILIILAVWGYLLFFGTPEATDDVFSNLGFDTPAATDQIDLGPVTDTDVLPSTDSTNPLRQLTTRQVAGFTFMGSSTDLVRYAERGTGHVYEINIDSREEKRVSGTTIPRVVSALFSESGEGVMIITDSDYTRTTYAGTIDEETGNTDFIELPTGAFDPTFINEHTVRYVVSTDSGTSGFELDIRESDSNPLFSIPLRDVSMLWDTATFVYNAPTVLFPGALYKVTGSLQAVTEAGFGFVAGVNDDYFLVSQNTDEAVVSSAVHRITGEETPLAIMYIPEKCTAIAVDPSSLWCASSFNTPNTSFLENWYKGVTGSEDMLWRVSISKGEAQLASNFTKEAGRIIDVDSIVSDYFGETPIFRNKVDGTLWLYDSRI